MDGAETVGGKWRKQRRPELRSAVVRGDDPVVLTEDDDGRRPLGYGPWVLRRGLASYIVDLLVLVFAVVSLGEAVAGTLEATRWLAVPAALAWSLPLLLRRRLPLLAPLAVFAALGLTAILDGDVVGNTAGGFGCALLAFWAVGVNNTTGQALAGFATGLGAIALVVQRGDQDLEDFLFVSFISSFAFAAGVTLHRRIEASKALAERAERAEEERERAANEAVAGERARLARELHDVVAHHVSVMTVQAGAVRRLLKPEQEREREALVSVEETGRKAHPEMRRLLGVLRPEGEAPELAPQPGMRTLGTLIDQVRAAGLPVELEVEGKAVELPPGVDLSAYRIVQEALTNTLKHAGPSRAWVHVRYGDEDVELSIENDGRESDDGIPPGHGLVGMRERVAVYGGTLESGPREGGGFTVRARLPIGTETT